MQDLRKLLERDKSELAWVLRCGLYGLQGGLQKALQIYKTDPGLSDCQDLVNKLTDLLESDPGQKQQILDKTPLPDDDSPFEPVLPLQSSPIPSPSQNEVKLIDLSEAFGSDPKLQTYLGKLQLQHTTDSDLWNQMQRLLLRVPINVSHSWRQQLIDRAQKIRALEDNCSPRQLPFSRDEVVYSGLKGEIKAQGLSLSRTLLLRTLLEQQHPQILQNKDLLFLRGVVDTCINFIELDSSLHHALKSIYRFGVTSLNSHEEKSKYIAALEDRFQRVLTAEDNPDSSVTLLARLDLDEAIHSLVYQPPADRYSWWGKLQEESRRTLDRVVEKTRNAGYTVQIRPLWGPYADVCALSKDDLELDSGGIKGEVLACLRVYAKINEKELPGRVLFRSLR